MSHIYSTYTRGTWVQKGNLITINSYFIDGVPLKIFYIDTVDEVQKHKIHLVKDNAGEFTNASVYVNNEKTPCHPSVDVCDIDGVKIKRLKVFFQNGVTSKWVEVEKRKYKAISLVVGTSLNLDLFFILKNVNFRKEGDTIVKEDND